MARAAWTHGARRNYRDTTNMSKRNKNATPAKGQLQVWWIPQVPGTPFTVDVDTPQEAKKLLDVLARYDAFQFEHRIKPDYCNAGGLRQWDGSEWEEWQDDNGDDIDEADL